MRYTLLVAAVSFALGIRLGLAVMPERLLWALLLGIALSLTAFAILPTSVARGALFLGALLVGIVVGGGQEDDVASGRVLALRSVTGRVASYPSLGEDTVSFVFDPDHLTQRLQVTVKTGTAGTPGRFHYGDRLRLQGRPRAPEVFDGFDYPSYLARQGIVATLWIEHLGDVARLPGEPWSLLRMGDQVRQRLIRRLRERLPSPQAALAQGLLFGDRSAMTDEGEASFRRAGVMHVLAVSGLHLGILLAGGWFVLRRLGLRPALAYPLVGVQILVLIGVIGLRVSLVRAGLMFGFLALGSVLADLGLVLRRSISPWNGLAAALVVTLALQPGELLNAGCQLSFCATAGILVAMGSRTRARWTRWIDAWADRAAPWGRPVRWAATLGLVSLAAQAGASPIVALHFGTVHLHVLWANLAAVPLVTLTLWLGLPGMILSACGVKGALAPLGWMTTALSWLVGCCARLPAASLDVPRWTGVWLGGLVALTWGIAYRFRSSS